MTRSLSQGNSVISHNRGEVVAYIGLGSNLGDRLASLRAAVERIDRLDRTRVDFAGGIAPVYETGPVGGPQGQPPYLNSVVRVRTGLPARELLDHLLAIERELGRVRVDKWESRIIDLDLLLYGDSVIDEPGLNVPHPRLTERRFVLDPLATIAGDALHPGLRTPISTLAQRARQAWAGQHVQPIAGPEWCSMRVR